MNELTADDTWPEPITTPGIGPTSLFLYKLPPDSSTWLDSEELEEE
jgi:hypothetical protein